MKQKDVLDHLSLLSRILYSSKKYEYDYKYGSNKVIRNRGLQDLRGEILLFKGYVEENYELYDFLTLQSSSDYHKNIIWSELTTVQFFIRDLTEAVNRLKEN